MMHHMRRQYEPGTFHDRLDGPVIMESGNSEESGIGCSLNDGIVEQRVGRYLVWGGIASSIMNGKDRLILLDCMA